MTRLTKPGKKFTAVLIALFCSVCLTSCFELTQVVTLKNGNYTVSYTCSMPTSFLDLMGTVAETQGTGVSSSDLISAMMDGMTTPETMPESTVTTSAVNASDLVVKNVCTFKNNTKKDDEKALIPVTKGKYTAVPLLLGEDELESASSSMFMLQYASMMVDPNSEEYNQFMIGLAAINAMMDGMKYKLFVGKSVVPSASRAYLPYYDDDTDGVDVVLEDLGDMYQVLIPFSYLMDVDLGTDNTVIVFEK